MSSWRQQALIEAPVEVVWQLVGDPRSYPEWAAGVVQVTGLPRVDAGEKFTQVSRGPLGKVTTTFLVDELDEMKGIRLRCTESGYFSHWLLTEARGSTFADVEFGMEPTALQYRAMDVMLRKRWYRRMLEQSLDGLRDALAHRSAAAAP